MKLKRIKQKVYDVIGGGQTKASNIFDGIIISLIIINIIMVIADTFKLPEYVQSIFNVIENISVIIFTIEYILRLWTSDCIYPELSPLRARIKYIFSFMAIIDLVAILPFYFPLAITVDLRVLRALRIIRLLRIFKISRYTDALASIGEVFKSKKNELFSSVMVVGLLMIMSAVVMYNVENAAQPDAFDNAFSALWWAIATFTTVGYGDIYPVTALGKVLSAVIALLGIGLVAVPTGIISAGFMEQIERKKTESEDDKKHYCPYCGHKLDE